jgi:hypothetical protein
MSNSRKIVIWLSMVVLLSIPQIVLAVGETKISAKLWNRYTTEVVAGEITGSAFTLERGYFTVEPTFADNIKGRFTIDVFSSDDAVDGAGLKLKFAYLDFSKVLPIPESKISVGLIRHYFGTAYDWEYISIQKSLEDKEGVAATADYGLALVGVLPAGYGEYAVSVVNGEGFKRTGDDLDKEPEILGNVRVTSLSGVTIGGSVLYENDESDRLAYAGVGHFSKGPFELWGEYLVQDRSDVTSNGFMVMPIMKLKNLTGIDVDIIGRFDMWDANTDVDDDGHMVIIGGLNWNITRDAKGTPQLFLQIQGERTIFEDDAIDEVNQLMVQLQWGFSNTLTQ